MITKINIISSNFFHRHIISDNVWMHGVAAERGREKNNKWFFRSLSQKSGVQIEKKNRMKICQYLYELELTSAISPLPFFALLSVDATQYTQNIKPIHRKSIWCYDFTRQNKLLLILLSVYHFILFSAVSHIYFLPSHALSNENYKKIFSQSRFVLFFYFYIILLCSMQPENNFSHQKALSMSWCSSRLFCTRCISKVIEKVSLKKVYIGVTLKINLRIFIHLLKTKIFKILFQ